MASLKRAFARSDSGAVLIEAAITLPLLLMVVLGILDFGRLFQQYEVVTNAAREGARVAVLPDYTQTDAETRALDYLEAGGLDRMLATASYIPGAAVQVGGTGPCITLVGMTVTYPHPYPFVGGIVQMFGGSAFGTVTLSATAKMRTEAMAIVCS